MESQEQPNSSNAGLEPPLEAAPPSSKPSPPPSSGSLGEKLKSLLWGAIVLVVFSFAWNKFNGGGVGCWPSKKIMVRQIHHFAGNDQKCGPFNVGGLHYVKDGKIGVWDDSVYRLLLFDMSGNFLDGWTHQDLDNKNWPKHEIDPISRGVSYGLDVPSLMSSGYPPDRVLDPQTNHFYVADYANWRINVTDTANKELSHIALKAKPKAVALDGIGRLFVGYADHNFVQVFSTKGGFLGDLEVQNPDTDMTYLDVRSLFITEDGLLVAGDKFSVWVYQILSR